MLHCGPLFTCSTAHLLLLGESHHGLHVRDRNPRPCNAGDAIAGLSSTGKLIRKAGRARLRRASSAVGRQGAASGPRCCTGGWPGEPRRARGGVGADERAGRRCHGPTAQHARRGRAHHGSAPSPRLTCLVPAPAGPGSASRPRLGSLREPRPVHGRAAVSSRHPIALGETLARQGFGGLLGRRRRYCAVVSPSTRPPPSPTTAPPGASAAVRAAQSSRSCHPTASRWPNRS